MKYNFIKFFIIFFFIIFLNSKVSISETSQDKIFKVKNISVNVESTSSFKAKEIAILEAQEKGFKNLMNKVVKNGKAHKVNSICGVFNNSVENQEYSMIHNYSITISKDDENNSSSPSDENEIYCMNIGNQKNTKCDVSLLKFINSIRDKSWFTRAEIINEKGENSFSILMGEAMKQLRGKVDGKIVSDKIKELLKD